MDTFLESKSRHLTNSKNYKNYSACYFLQFKSIFIFWMKCWRCSQRENKPQWIQTTAFGPKLPQRHIWPQYIEAGETTKKGTHHI